MSTDPEATAKEWHLDPETEYRFELDPGTSLAVTVLKGQAEVFGAELVEGKHYLFGHECKAAIFSWQGCTLEICSPSTEYISDETPMVAYGNVHLALEQLRVRAACKLHGSPTFENPNQETSAEPPRVLVLGPEHSGKTTVSKLLINYCTRVGQGWAPVLVNVDPSEGGWASPGSISACPVDSPIPTFSPANPLGTAATSAPTSVSSNALVPLVYWYGHTETRTNPVLLDRLIRTLGLRIEDRWNQDPEGSMAGLIVDTPSSFASGTAASNEDRQRLIRACVEAFKINTILVVGHEKLFVEMQRTFSSANTSPSVNVVKIPKSGGTVELDISYRERVQNHQIHGYMYGHNIPPPQGMKVSGGTGFTLGGESFTDWSLAPSSAVIGFDELDIYRVGAESMAPSSALPIGADRVVSEIQPAKVDPSSPGSGLLHAVLGLLAPFPSDESERYDEEILDLNIIGFIIITNIDMANRKMTILSPNQGSLTGKTAVVGTIEWLDQ